MHLRAGCAAGPRQGHLLDDLAAVNRNVLLSRGPAGAPPDLLDQQDALVLRLAELVDLDAIRRHDGTMDVTADGRLLVSGKSAKPLEVVLLGDGGVEVRQQKSQDVVRITGGRIGGFLALLDSTVPAHRATLDHIRRPGCWFTGEERLAIAREGRLALTCPRCAERNAALSPEQGKGAHAGTGELPEVLVDAGNNWAGWLAIQEHPSVVRDWLFDRSTFGLTPVEAGIEAWGSALVIVAVAAATGFIADRRYRRLM